MNDKKMSVIVPVYNAEKFLNRAIDSLLRQTLEDIEIILVDDGSKDNCPQICDDYAKKDNRIIVIHKENAGQAQARNKGLEIATGKYIMFMDSDDMYEDYACEYMYNFAEEKKADYVSANYIIIDEFDKKREKPAFDTELYDEFKLKLSDPAKSFFVMNATSWNKIYNSEFLNKNKIQFDLNPPSEDDYFTLLCYMKAKRGYYTNKVIYNYRYNPDSTSNKCDKEYFEKQNYVYKVIYILFKEKRKMRLYNRYYYAKKSAYLLGKIIDSDLVSLEEKRNIIENLKWLFSLAEDVDNFIYNESLKPIFKYIKNDEYEDAIKQIEYVKKIRKIYSDFEKSRMFFPTRENLQLMPKYDNDFLEKELELMGDNEDV